MGPRDPILSTQGGHLHADRSPDRGMRDVGRLTATLGSAVRDERRRRRLTVRQLASLSGLSKSCVHKVEMGEPASLETYVRIGRALGLRADVALTDPRRRDGSGRHQTDVVHAAMGEAQAARLRAAGFEVRMDEPYQHYQFAGRGDVVAWSTDNLALLHIENRTQFPDIQDAFGSFNGKRAYLGRELAMRAGVARWQSETHVIAALWSADVLRTLRHHRASFAAVCPDPPDAFAAWWANNPPFCRSTTLVFFDPLEGTRSDRRRWVAMSELDGLRPRYRDYAEAAQVLQACSMRSSFT